MTVTVRLDPRHGAVRGVRALVLAVPAVAVAALAHRTVDSCLDLPGLALSLATCWSMAVAVLGTRRRLPVLLGWLIAAQVATHLMLQATCSAPGPVLPGPRALAAHLAAAVALAVVLHRADSRLWTADGLLRALLRLLAPRLPRVLPVPAPFLVPAPAAARRPLAPAPASPVVRRGPPSSALP